MLRRREVFVLGGGAALSLMCPTVAFADENGIVLSIPDIVENPASVPVRVSAEGAMEITLTAEGGIPPQVLTFALGPLAIAREIATHVRLDGVRRLTAVARMPDGSVRRTSRVIPCNDCTA